MNLQHFIHLNTNYLSLIISYPNYPLTEENWNSLKEILSLSYNLLRDNGLLPNNFKESYDNFLIGLPRDSSLIKNYIETHKSGDDLLNLVVDLLEGKYKEISDEDLDNLKIKLIKFKESINNY